jgi:hypothetical protein
MQPTTAISILALMLSLLGPAPADSPQTLELKPGDKIVAIGDSITSQGVYLRDINAVFAQQYPELKIPPVVNKGISGQVAVLKSASRSFIRDLYFFHLPALFFLCTESLIR